MNSDSADCGMPTELYCLKCKARRPVLNVSLKETTYTTAKNSRDVKRTIYQGTCSSCQKNVSCFAKGKKVANPAPYQAPGSAPKSIVM